VQGAPEKNGATDSWPSFCQILADLRIFFTRRFPGKCAVKWILKVPSHLAYVAALPCETLVSAKQAINDRLQGIAARILPVKSFVNRLTFDRIMVVSLWPHFWTTMYMEREFVNLNAQKLVIFMCIVIIIITKNVKINSFV